VHARELAHLAIRLRQSCHTCASPGLHLVWWYLVDSARPSLPDAGIWWQWTVLALHASCRPHHQITGDGELCSFLFVQHLLSASQSFFFQRVMTVFPAQQKRMLYYLFLWRTSGKHFSIGERGEREGSSGEDGLLADLVLDLQCQI